MSAENTQTTCKEFQQQEVQQEVVHQDGVEFLYQTFINYEERIRSLEGSIQTSNNQIRSLENSVQTSNNQITSLKNLNQTLNNNIKELKETITSLRSDSLFYKIIFFIILILFGFYIWWTQNVHRINIQLLSEQVEVEIKKDLFNNHLELVQKQFLEFIESVKYKN
ncbi:hypothetical protein C2G38_2291005 [Gigaspora rosea]|uniref:Uncharacterized protein n=1 Tax=Gigaspora rosea TaxID=44941 RepID=A0A397U553_9GLOM|nr:hypothetical protein C2G38_2291005 [Gigaspora rosea]